METQSSLILTLVLAFGFMVSAFVFLALILQSAVARDAEEKAAGLLAKEFVEDALHVGATYRLQTKEKGKFGRYLGTIYLTDDTSINAALVKERLAVPYFGQSKVRVQEAHLANRKLLKEMGWL
jgi:endonuclease YncB( thermonuclease family)